jgi:hypothetical protein
MYKGLARTRMHPLRASPQRIFDQRPSDASVGTGDQDCLVFNIPFSFVEPLLHSKTSNNQAAFYLVYCAWYRSGKYTSALTSLRYRFAPRHMPLSGAMIVPPIWVSEYSTAMTLDCVTRLVIKPADSRSRRVLVSIR